jgi:hypothetical protein
MPSLLSPAQGEGQRAYEHVAAVYESSLILKIFLCSTFEERWERLDIDVVNLGVLRGQEDSSVNSPTNCKALSA